MGEKGNVSALTGAAPLLAGAEQSLIERVTTTTTSTVVGVGEDLATTIRDKAVEAVADSTVTSARQRLERDPGIPGSGSDSAAPSGSPDPSTPPVAPPA